MKMLKIHDPMFSLPISLFVGSWEDFVKMKKKIFGEKDKSDAGRGGHTVSDGCQTVMWIADIEKAQSFPTIVHEVFHHAMNVAHFRGVPLEKDNDEVFAYYVEMITRNIIREVVKLKTKKL